jgi:hypothetical protein
MPSRDEFDGNIVELPYQKCGVAHHDQLERLGNPCVVAFSRVLVKTPMNIQSLHHHAKRLSRKISAAMARRRLECTTIVACPTLFGPVIESAFSKASNSVTITFHASVTRLSKVISLMQVQSCELMPEHRPALFR